MGVFSSFLLLLLPFLLSPGPAGTSYIASPRPSELPSKFLLGFAQAQPLNHPRTLPAPALPDLQVSGQKYVATGPPLGLEAAVSTW